MFGRGSRQVPEVGEEQVKDLHAKVGELLSSADSGKTGAADRTRTYDPIITNFAVHVLDVTGPSRLKPYNSL